MGMNALEVRRRVMLAQPHEAVASGAVASFRTDVISPLPLEFDLVPIQAGTGDPSPDNIRPITGHDGFTVYDDPKYGGLIWWNQTVYGLARIQDWSYNSNNSSFAISDNIGIFTKNANVGDGVGYVRPGQGNTDFVSGHKYFATIDVKGTANIDLTLFSNLMASGGKNYTIQSTDKWETVTNLFTSGSSNPSVRRIVWIRGQHDNDVTVQFKNYMLLDLTEMFGVGNEPSTVEAVKALFPLDYYAYNAGTQETVSEVNGDTIPKSVVTFPTPPGTVYGCHFVNNGDGTGTLTVTHEIVDLGSLSWNYVNLEKKRFMASLTGVKRPETDSVVPNIYCTTYKPETYANLFYNVVNKCISVNNSNDIVAVYDTSYTDKNVFASAMTGQKLVYPLATPQTYTLSLTALQSLIGQNHIWVDNADSVTVEYWGH